MLMPRMQLVERLAVTRTYFNGTECMAALIGLWDDYDANKYSIELLKQVFKSMRQIVNDHWVGIILQVNHKKSTPTHTDTALLHRPRTHTHSTS